MSIAKGLRLIAQGISEIADSLEQTPERAPKTLAGPGAVPAAAPAAAPHASDLNKATIPAATPAAAPVAAPAAVSATTPEALFKECARILPLVFKAKGAKVLEDIFAEYRTTGLSKVPKDKLGEVLTKLNAVLAS